MAASGMDFWCGGFAAVTHVFAGTEPAKATATGHVDSSAGDGCIAGRARALTFRRPAADPVSSVVHGRRLLRISPVGSIE